MHQFTTIAKRVSVLIGVWWIWLLLTFGFRVNTQICLYEAFTSKYTWLYLAILVYIVSPCGIPAWRLRVFQWMIYESCSMGQTTECSALVLLPKSHAWPTLHIWGSCPTQCLTSRRGPNPLKACQALSGTLSSILWPKYLQHLVKFHIALDFTTVLL